MRIYLLSPWGTRILQVALDRWRGARNPSGLHPDPACLKIKARWLHWQYSVWGCPERGRLPCLASKCPCLNVCSQCLNHEVLFFCTKHKHNTKKSTKIKFSLVFLSFPFLAFLYLFWNSVGFFVFIAETQKPRNSKFWISRVSSRVPQETGFFVDAREVCKWKNHMT